MRSDSLWSFLLHKMENAENAMVLLYDVCRLCLDEPGVDNIFKPVDWTQDILNYTGVKVQLSKQ